MNGRWPFASGCQHADYIVGHSVVIENGEAQTLPNGAPDARLCYMPADRCQIIDTWTTTGLRGSGSHDFAIRVREHGRAGPASAAPLAGALARCGVIVPVERP